jgi:hypothetical protein
MADTRVVPVSAVKYGLKAETSFGVGLDSDLSTGGDTTAYLTQPVIQAQKPTFNITRESRLLSGRGVMKHQSDSVINSKGGTVTMPFDMLATPKTLIQHLALVGHTPSTSGTTIHIQTFSGASTTSMGGTVTDGVPHSCNLGWYDGSSAGGIRVCGVVCSDLTISGDVAANNGLLSMSGNYFSGFSAAPSDNYVTSTTTALEVNLAGTWGAAQTTHFNIMEMTTRTLDVEAADNAVFTLKSFNLNISNGVNRFGFDANGNAEGYAFPEYVITGDLTIKYDDLHDFSAASNVVQDFISGNTQTLNMIIGDGTHSAEGEMEITAEIQYTGDPALDLSEAGVYINLPFEVVSDGTFGLKTEVFHNAALTTL